MAKITMAVRAKGHQTAKVEIEHIQHCRTLTSNWFGRGNTDLDLYRVVATGHEFELETGDEDLAGNCLRVREQDAHLYGLARR